MVWHGDGLLRATARPAMAVLGGLTLSITVGNNGNKGLWICQQTVLANDRVRKIYFGFQLFRDVILRHLPRLSRRGLETGPLTK